MLSGAAGQLYGNRYIWRFLPGWQTNLATIGVIQFGYMQKLFAARKWYDLVPDQQHVFVTAGYGTFRNTGQFATKPGGRFASNDYVTATVTPDGALGMAYLPQGGTITVDLSKLKHNVTARWFDPSANTFQAIACRRSHLRQSYGGSYGPAGRLASDQHRHAAIHRARQKQWR